MKHYNLWAPWRMKYIQDLSKSKDCFICHNLKNPHSDDENLVLWRSTHCIVILNRFPYNNGHLLIAPARHIADLDQATDEELLELVKLTRQSQKVLSLALKPHGFNIGMNFGRCAGAGLPEHLHVHIVPRWAGDTNFITVVGQVRVMPDSLEAVAAQYRDTLKELGTVTDFPPPASP